MTYLAGTTSSDTINMHKVGEYVAAKSAVIDREKNVAEFQALMADCEALAQKTLSMEPSTLVAGLVFRVSIFTSFQAMAAGAKKLGPQQDAERLQSIYNTMSQRRVVDKNKELLVDGMEVQKKK